MKIEDLTLWKAFQGVAQQGNFSKASKAMNVPVPQISKRVAKLEDLLGIRLFHRSTRVVSLTDEGVALLPKVTNALDDLTEIESSFQEQGKLSGIVKVTCVPYVAHRLLVPAMKKFWEKHPRIKIDLQLTKQFVNIIENNIDMAIRIQTPSDTELIYKKLAPNDLVFCASPGYLKRNRNSIKYPNDLKNHDLLFLKIHEKCKFKDSALQLKKFSHRKKLESDNGVFLTDMALKDYGILVRAKWDVEEHFKKGRLVQVLARNPLETFGHIHAVIPSKRYLAPRVRAFFDFVVEQSSQWK